MTGPEIWTNTVGLDQGDPASPVLWQLVMEAIILEISDALSASTPRGSEVVLDSYADDGFAGRIGTMDAATAHRTIFDLAEACTKVETKWGFSLPMEKIDVVIKGRHSAKALVSKGWPRNLPLAGHLIHQTPRYHTTARQREGKVGHLPGKAQYSPRQVAHPEETMDELLVVNGSDTHGHNDHPCADFGIRMRTLGDGHDQGHGGEAVVRHGQKNPGLAR